MGAQGVTTVNFGAFPGQSDATVTVTGQAAIVAGSLVEAWLRPVATADHTAEEHIVENIRVRAYNIVAGVGFDVKAIHTGQLNEPTPTLLNRSILDPSMKAVGTRLYGLWTVAWAWN